MPSKQYSKPFHDGRAASVAGSRFCPLWMKQKVIYKRETSQTTAMSPCPN
jgi:hypothetical protein